MSSFQDYLLAIDSGKYKRKIRINLLRDDESIREEITYLLENSIGNLNCQRNNGVRRTCDFEIINLDNKYIPNIENFYIHQKFSLELGLELPDGTDFFLPQGIFIVDDPVVSSIYSKSTIRISGTDKFSLLNSDLGGELGNSYIINIGTDISQAIRSVLQLSGDTKPPIIDISLLGLTNPYTMIYEPTDNLGKILVDLAQIYSCSCYYNEFGQLVISKDADDSVKSSLWDFSPDQFVYQGATSTHKWSEVFNSCRVVGSNFSGTSVSYKTSNLNLLSPTSIPNLNNRERVFYYTTDTISTVQQCIDLSEYILKRKTAIQNQVQINSICMYHLDVDEICTLTDPKLGFNQERFIINDLSISLQTNGQMSINAIKSKEIPFI